MLNVISFRAKPGKEKELEALLGDEKTTRRLAKTFGQKRNALFLKDGRMIRVLEVEDGAEPPDIAALARDEPWFRETLEDLSELVEDPFDVDDDASITAWMQRSMFPQVFDIRV